jgi:integrase
MASISPRPNGTFQAIIRRKGYAPLSKVCASRSEALKWSRGVESDIDRGVIKPQNNLEPTFKEALARYLAEVTPTKKSKRQETNRIAGVVACCAFISKRLRDITPSDVSQYIQTRQGQTTKRGGKVTGSTINRDLALISHVFQTATKQWMIPNLSNPVDGVSRLRENQARCRRLISPDGVDELALIISKTYSAKVRIAFELLVELACRRGELVKLQWQDVSIADRTVTFRETKNGFSRTVPMSKRAQELFRQLQESGDSGAVLGLSVHTLSDAWRKARIRAGVSGARLHDVRREGVSRLFEDVGLGTLEVASISGHRSLAMLAVYSSFQTKNLLTKLDQATAKQAPSASTSANEVQA